MEKHLLVTAAKIVGNSKEGVWTQTYSFEPPLPEEKASRGDLYCVIDISSSVDFDVSAIGKAVLTRLEKEYYANVGAGILVSLEDAVRKAYKVLLEEVVVTTDESGVFEFNLTAAVVWGVVVYFAKVGEGKVYLWRGNSLKQLLSATLQGVEKEELQVETISGPMQDGDVFIIGSPQFYKVISEDTIAGHLDHQPVQDVADIFVPILYRAENSAAACAIFLGVKSEEVPSPQEEEIQFVDTSEVEKKEIEELPKDVILPKNEARVGTGFNFAKVGGMLGGVVQNIIDRIPKRSGDTTIRLRDESQQRSKKTTLVIAVIILLILVVVVFVGTNRRESQKKNEQFQSLYSEAKTRFEHGRDLIDINLETAKPDLLKAKEKLEEARKLHLDDKKVDELLQQVNDQLKVASRDYILSSPSVFLDLSLIKQGATADRTSLYENKLGILDTKNNVVYGVDLKSKSQSILGGGADNISSSPVYVALYGAYVYVFSKEKGIVQIDTENKKTKVVVEKDSSWGDISEMMVFTSNIYLLDKGKNQVWIYRSGASEFSSIKSWLSADTVADFSKAVDMTIDGSIWVMTKDGDVWKYLRGVRDSFNINGLDQSLSAPSVIFTNEDAKNLYILDKSQKRIVLISKENGAYQAQYHGDVFGQTVGLVADEKNKILYIVNSDKIYSTELK